VNGLLIPVVVLLAVPLHWCAIMKLIAFAGGWRDLAKRYAARGTLPPDKTFRFSYGRMGAWCGYNGCLRYDLGPLGLGLSMLILFSTGHPPLLIPWDEVVFLEECSFGFKRGAKLAIGSPRRTTLTVPHAVYEAIRPYLR